MPCINIVSCVTRCIIFRIHGYSFEICHVNRPTRLQVKECLKLNWFESWRCTLFAGVDDDGGGGGNDNDNSDNGKKNNRFDAGKT